MPTVTLPFFEVLSSLLIILALRRRSWWLFGLAGAVLGLGIYSYGSYPFFPVAAGFFVVFWLLTNRREWRRTLVLQLALLAAVALLAAAPMFSYAKANDDEYFRVARSTLLFNSQQYKEANGLTGKADVILDAGRDYVRYAVFDSYFDYVDASGTAPMLDPVTAVALGLGVLLALRRWRTPAVALALAAFFVLPWAGILTEAAAFRRTLGVTPYVALLAALPLAALWDGARKRARWQAAAGGLIVVCALAVAAFLNLNHYFGSFADHAHSRWVFAADLTEASEFMNELPPATYVYFYSERWSFDYETRRYLAPDRLGEDRSEEFSESGTLSLTPEGDADVAYVFLSPYLDHADLVESGYPGGTRFEHVGDGGLVAFVAYLLPASEFPAEPIEGPQERDRTRVANLAAIQRVLESYRDDTGLYIRTHGEIQTLCVSQRADLGCALRDYLDPLPQDPLGDPAANGYWYASDGETYALYAQRESEALPPCEEHPSHLLQFASLLCVLGP